MPLGGGPYDDVASIARELTEAQAVVLIVINGTHGNGFTVQEMAPPGHPPQVVGAKLVALLRNMADGIESDLPALENADGN